MSWLEPLPLSVTAAIIVILLCAAAMLGYRGHRWWLVRQGEAAPESHDHLLSAMLGLLALLLGFTFSLALNRYEARRDLVVQEANAIGTTWLRAQLLEEPDRTRISSLLRAYLDTRLAWSEVAAEAGDGAQAAALRRQLWSVTGHAVRSDPNPQLSRGLMDALNQSFDMASARSAARSAHVPSRVLDVLLIYAVISAAMLGYTSATKGKPHRVATAMVLILLTLALTMILDIDKPRGGAIQVSQAPLEELSRSWPAGI